MYFTIDVLSLLVVVEFQEVCPNDWGASDPHGESPRLSI
jgi:hypothetical protein